MLAEAVGAVSTFGRRVGRWSVGSPIAAGARNKVAGAVGVVTAVGDWRIVGYRRQATKRHQHGERNCCEEACTQLHFGPY
jgi:hypothetical protein